MPVTGAESPFASQRPVEAIARARDLLEHGGKDVRITITKTPDVFTTDDFESPVKEKNFPASEAR